MRLFRFPRMLICLVIFSVFLFRYVDKHNLVMELRYRLPELADELRALKEKGARLLYEVECFESPLHLMELLRQPEYSHLEHPLADDIWYIPEDSTDFRS